MGTTLTAAYSMGIDLFIVHLGDSRVYLHRRGVLKQLTKDHTVAQAMADAGYISPEDVRRHVKRNALTNFLGGHHGKVKAELRWLRLNDGDRLLLCSDGLNEMVDDADDRADPRAAGRPARRRPAPARGGPQRRRQGQRDGRRRPLPGDRPQAVGSRSFRRAGRSARSRRRPTPSPRSTTGPPPDRSAPAGSAAAESVPQARRSSRRGRRAGGPRSAVPTPENGWMNPRAWACTPAARTAAGTAASPTGDRPGR